MPKSLTNDLSRSLAAFDQPSTLIAVIEMGLEGWLVAGVVPGMAREPLKKIPPHEERLWVLLQRWRAQAVMAGSTITRVVVAFEAGRDGFWLARWLRAKGVEAYVFHASSIAAPREDKRAKTDRLDTGMQKRALLGWLRGERGHCKMAAIPSLEEEDDKRPCRERKVLVVECGRIVNRLKAVLVRLGIKDVNIRLQRTWAKLDDLRTPQGEPIPPKTRREMERQIEHLKLLQQQIKEIEDGREKALAAAPATDERARAMKQLAEVHGLGLETADLLVGEVLSRDLRDRRALARYAGLTGSPDESGKKRREKGLARSGNLRVRTAMIQMAWRFLGFQKNCALVRWFEERSKGVKSLRKIMIVGLARKLLIALWRLVKFGEVPEGLELRPA
jgi:transposase